MKGIMLKPIKCFKRFFCLSSAQVSDTVLLFEDCEELRFAKVQVKPNAILCFKCYASSRLNDILYSSHTNGHLRYCAGDRLAQ